MCLSLHAGPPGPDRCSVSSGKESTTEGAAVPPGGARYEDVRFVQRCDHGVNVRPAIVRTRPADAAQINHVRCHVAEETVEADDAGAFFRLERFAVTPGEGTVPGADYYAEPVPGASLAVLAQPCAPRGGGTSGAEHRLHGGKKVGVTSDEDNSISARVWLECACRPEEAARDVNVGGALHTAACLGWREGENVAGGTELRVETQLAVTLCCGQVGRGM
eukprot:scaffold198115_cov33-Tisochrysis_lutea.AAC.1